MGLYGGFVHTNGHVTGSTGEGWLVNKLGERKKVAENKVA
jgi:hypothetical protein